MVTNEVDQSLINCEFYEHICLENIKKLYKTTAICEDQHQYKAIFEVAMVSTLERCYENSSIDT